MSKSAELSKLWLCQELNMQAEREASTIISTLLY